MLSFWVHSLYFALSNYGQRSGFGKDPPRSRHGTRSEIEQMERRKNNL
jgi:hypothetical protein